MFWWICFILLMCSSKNEHEMWQPALPRGSDAALDHGRWFLSVFQTGNFRLDESSPLPASQGEGERLFWKLGTFLCLQQQRFPKAQGVLENHFNPRRKWSSQGRKVVTSLSWKFVGISQKWGNSLSFQKNEGLGGWVDEKGAQGKEMLRTDRLVLLISDLFRTRWKTLWKLQKLEIESRSLLLVVNKFWQNHTSISYFSPTSLLS